MRKFLWSRRPFSEHFFCLKDYHGTLSLGHISAVQIFSKYKQKRGVSVTLKLPERRRNGPVRVVTVEVDAGKEPVSPVEDLPLIQDNRVGIVPAPADRIPEEVERLRVDRREHRRKGVDLERFEVHGVLTTECHHHGMSSAAGAPPISPHDWSGAV